MILPADRVRYRKGSQSYDEDGRIISRCEMSKWAGLEVEQSLAGATLLDNHNFTDQYIAFKTLYFVYPFRRCLNTDTLI